MFHIYKYPRAALTTDAIITTTHNNEESLLLIKRKFNPFKNMWALPGGFTGIDETLKDACARELLEETGISCPGLEQLYTFDNPERDPRHRAISVVFHGKVSSPKELIAGDDAKEARWFPLHSLPKMAFDHKEIIDFFLKRENK